MNWEWIFIAGVFALVVLGSVCACIQSRRDEQARGEAFLRLSESIAANSPGVTSTQYNLCTYRDSCEIAGKLLKEGESIYYADGKFCCGGVIADSMEDLLWELFESSALEQQKTSKAALKKLADEAQELDMGY